MQQNRVEYEYKYLDVIQSGLGMSLNSTKK